jgi:hypothetical protein
VQQALRPWSVLLLLLLLLLLVVDQLPSAMPYSLVALAAELH